MAIDTHHELRLLHRLRSAPELFERIASVSGSEFSIQKKLRSQFPEDLVRAALTLRDDRMKAQGVLSQPLDLWLTRVALQQSTSPAVAQYKARRFPDGVLVADLCSGIGVDAAALADRGPVLAVDSDPAMSLRLKWNAQIWGQQDNLIPASMDVRRMRLKNHLVHVDPDRRSGREKAALRLENYCPDLRWMQELTGSAAGGALKLGPASNFQQKFPGCEIELISENGQCREATVWFGDLASDSPFRATVLPAGESIHGHPLSVWLPVADCVGDYLYDPDPAVVRSGLLDPVADRFGLSRLDADEEYLTGARIVQTAFVRCFRVDAVLSGNEKELKRYLRQHPGCRYEIKCRRIPVNTSALQRRLKTGDGPVRVVIFARVQGRTQIILAQRVAG